MKIAIVAPSPVPFTVGGAENLFWGLQSYINEHTPHQCELIKVASPESNLEQLIDSYAKFSELELDHFDCVISTKYPAWMVRHRNHVCYMLHRLRGLYDTYHFTGLPEEVDWFHPDMREAAALAKHLEQIADRDTVCNFPGLQGVCVLTPESFTPSISRPLLALADSLPGFIGDGSGKGLTLCGDFPSRPAAT